MAKQPEKSSKGYPIPYHLQRREMKLKAPHSDQEKKEQKKTKKGELNVYYADQALKAPSKCENCGKNLQATINFHPRAHIAHIVPKTGEGGCPSVATHPQNKWYGCLDCHTFYDQKIAEQEFHELITMPVIPIVISRFQFFMADIPLHERKNIPAFLLTDKGDSVDLKKTDVRPGKGKTGKGSGKKPS